MKRLAFLLAMVLSFLVFGCGTSGKTSTTKKVPYTEWNQDLSTMIFNGQGVFTELPNSLYYYDNTYTSVVYINDQYVTITSLCCPMASIDDAPKEILYLCGFKDNYEWSVDSSKSSKRYIKFQTDGYNYTDEVNLSFKLTNPQFYKKSGITLGVQITVNVSSGESEITPSVNKIIFKSK